MKTFPLLLALLVLLATGPALALDLHTARTTGVVGEKADGYVAVLTPSADASALVDNVNAQRKQEYTRISKEKGQPVDVIANLAAQEIINKLDAGSMYQDASGAWKKR